MSDDPNDPHFDHSQHDQPQIEMPFNALPPTAVALAVAIIGIELLFQIGSYGIIGGPEAIGWHASAVSRFGFLDSVFDAMLAEGRWPFEHVLRLISYSFIHDNFTHAMMVCVFILALGKLVGEAFGAFSVLLIFVLSAVFGAGVFGLVLTTKLALLGGFSGAYGLIGAYTLILWIGMGAAQQNPLRAFSLIGFLMGLQLVFSFFASDPSWVANLAGFVTGFLVSILLVPGAIPRIFARIRQR